MGVLTKTAKSQFWGRNRSIRPSPRALHLLRTADPAEHRPLELGTSVNRSRLHGTDSDFSPKAAKPAASEQEFQVAGFLSEGQPMDTLKGYG
jgi:hypothetical protein